MNKPVFISYPSQNEAAASAVCSYLEKRGIRCWIAPRDISPGEEYATALIHAINHCRTLVLIFSAHTNTSTQVRREVERAVTKGKIIIPIRVESATPSESMEYFIGNTHWLDALTPPLENHLEQLFVAISSFISAFEKVQPSIAKPPPVTRPPGAKKSGNLESEEKAGFGSSSASQTIKLELSGPMQHQARAVIDCARVLTSRCHCREITHRLLMAAFVSDSDGFASRVCRAAGADPRLLWSLLIAMSYQESDAEPENYPPIAITNESAGRILLPVIEQARQQAGETSAISEADLFRAFCAKADPAFAELLKSQAADEALEISEVDLSELGKMDPDQPDLFINLTLRARAVVRQAHKLALDRQVHPIPNRLLLAAFLSDSNHLAHQLLTRFGIPVEKLCQLLIKSATGKAPVEQQLDANACARIVTPAIQRARTLAGTAGIVTERLLWRAFCELAEPRMKVELKAAGIDLDQFADADPASADTIPPPQNKKPLPPTGGNPLWN